MGGGPWFGCGEERGVQLTARSGLPCWRCVDPSAAHVGGLGGSVPPP